MVDYQLLHKGSCHVDVCSHKRKTPMKHVTRARRLLLMLVLLFSLVLASSAFAAEPAALKSSQKVFSQRWGMGEGCAEHYGASTFSLPPVEQ
jgi:hypothetical protein